MDDGLKRVRCDVVESDNVLARRKRPLVFSHSTAGASKERAEEWRNGSEYDFVTLDAEAVS